MGVESDVSVAHFRQKVESETETLTEMCAHCRNILKVTPDLPEDIHGDIMVAVGQAALLMKERFSQFVGLIDDCEFKRREKEVTCQDLQGFWDIIYFQVEDVQDKFNTLMELENRGWCKKQSPSDIAMKKPLPVKKAEVKKPMVTKPRPGGASNLKAHIEAARRKLKQQQKDNNTNSVSSSTNNFEVPVPAVNNRNEDIMEKPLQTVCTPKKSSSNCVRQEGEAVVFDAGFFKVETPSKKKNKENLKKQHTPGRVEQRVLASTVLKERLQDSPTVHKDYSPCMRVTRSMKKNLRNTKINKLKL